MHSLNHVLAILYAIERYEQILDLIFNEVQAQHFNQEEQVHNKEKVNWKIEGF